MGMPPYRKLGRTHVLRAYLICELIQLWYYMLTDSGARAQFNHSVQGTGNGILLAEAI